MATDKKISELPLAGSLEGSELLAVVQDSETRKVSVSNLLLNATGKFKGEWNNTGTYSSGDVVLHDLLIWEANANNTNEEPGTGPSWDLQAVTDDAYGAGWNGSLIPPSSNALYDKFESLESDFDSVYYRLDGTFPLEGNMDCNNYNLESVSQLNSAVIYNSGLLHVGNSPNLQGETKQSIEIIPSSGDASLLFCRTTSADIASFDFITGTNVDTGWSFEYYDSDGHFHLLDRVNNRTHVDFTNDGKSRWLYGSLIVDNNSYGLVLKSSVDSHYYQYAAGVAGALVITDLGTSY